MFQENYKHSKATSMLRFRRRFEVFVILIIMIKGCHVLRKYARMPLEENLSDQLEFMRGSGTIICVKETVQHMPTVKFLLPSIKREAETFTMFLHRDNANWQTYIFDRHPKLNMLAGVKDSEKIYKVCYQYVKEFRAQHGKEYRRALAQNEKLWRPIEQKYLQILEEHFEVKFPTRQKLMYAYVSVIPVYPRWIDEWSFNVSYFVPKRVKEIACHEIQHLLYFKKWMEVFPRTKRVELDNPHLVWRLSELIAPVILNEHPYFKTLFTRKQMTYKNFQEIRIQGRQPMIHLTGMYRRHLKSGAPFESFLKNIWEFAKKHEDVIMGV